MDKILIKGGRVIDPANNLDGIADILVEGSLILEVSSAIKAKADMVIDARNKIVIPGIVDLHTHLREPGREDKETVASGTLAAAKGGVTSVLAMPNTLTAMDSAENVSLLKEIIKKTAHINVFICGAISKGRLGKELAEIKGMKKEGIVALSDDGSSVEDEALMLEAFKISKQEKLIISCHSEDKLLSEAGVVNSGFTSTRLGLKGISKESEYKRVARDIALAKKADAALHIAHVSCKESAEVILRAKKEGVVVTAEVTPHHFSLSEEAVLDYDTYMKVNPPLRSKEDVAALKEALKSEVIDAIASDHAPHTENEKDIEFDRAEFGTIGLETMLAVSASELIEPGLLGWQELVKRLSFTPARILGINKGTLSRGADADIVIIDPLKEWRVKKAELVSKSKNSAFLGKSLKGVVEYTICGGRIAYALYPRAVKRKR